MRLTIFDEYHAQTWDVVEALGRAATRHYPRILYFSYAAPRSGALHQHRAAAR